MAVEDTHALMIDEHTFTEFKIDMCDLEVAASQAALLLAHDLIHPLLGRRVVVTQGSRRGYEGVIKDIGNTSVTIELNALFTGSNSPLQLFAWHHLRQMSAEEDIAKTNPGRQQATPPPNPDGNQPQGSMPEPKGSHWIFTKEIQTIIEWKTFLFYIRNTHESDDKPLQTYKKSTGRTILGLHHTTTPKEGKVILSITRCSCMKEILVHPRFLILWEPMVSSEVIAIQGLWFGIPGTVKEEKGEGQWLVEMSSQLSRKLINILTIVDISQYSRVLNVSQTIFSFIHKWFSLQESCGQFLLRCVHPFIVANNLIVIAWEQVSPGSTHKSQFLTKDIMEKYGVYSAAALSFSEEFQMCLEQGDLKNVERSLCRGIGTGHSSDLNCVKGLTAKMASQTDMPLPLVSQTKLDCGFHNDATGHMLLPIKYLTSYNKDPVG
ncbi:hypothetical protein EI94DRAFT_1710775, partial [Lactarius quietus]